MNLKKRYIEGFSNILIVFTSTFIFCSGCTFTWWDKPEPYYYSFTFKNETNSTIELKLSPQAASNEYITIFPESQHEVFGFKVDEREDVILDGLFGEDDNRFMDEVTVFWQDTLYHIWYGPIREMDKSIHHFFNVNSWKVIEYTDPGSINGSAIFSIIESDLIDNNLF